MIECLLRWLRQPSRAELRTAILRALDVSGEPIRADILRKSMGVCESPFYRACWQLLEADEIRMGFLRFQENGQRFSANTFEITAIGRDRLHLIHLT